MADFKHFFLSNTSTSENYKTTRRGSGKFKSPPRDSRETHGGKLHDQFQQVRASVEQQETEGVPNSADLLFVPLAVEGLTVSADGKELSGIDLDKFDSESKDIRIINVRMDGERQIATVALPKNQLDYFEKKFTDYISKDRSWTNPNTGEVKSSPTNKKLVESIEDLRLAALPDFYTDSDKNIPAPEDTIWWEVWLERIPDDDSLDDFKTRASTVGIEFSTQHVRFPEVVVILARGSIRQWTQVPGLFAHLAEFRRAKIVSTEFVDLPPSDQAEFINDLLDRTTFAEETAPAVTVLDTGANRGHLLLADSFSEDDAQCWKEEWGSADRQGHGTEMAGVALFGARLKDLLYNTEPLLLMHRLESVKVLPDVGDNDPPDYGPITAGSMRKAESQSPHRSRVYCLAITADDRDQFKPSLWSAALDQAISGRDDEIRRFVAVSGGNLFTQPGAGYPDVNHLASVQDPAQSWNAITIGAYTDMVQIQEPMFDGWNPVASKGTLSPASTTSVGWQDLAWPIKPELVLEGGNYATDGANGFSDAADLSLLTTKIDATGALLGLTRDTSPATAQAARMAAMIKAEYPDYWPETLRGMLVHNAEWTTEMEAEFPVKKKNKIPPARLRTYGWGVPSLERSLACAKHIATMVIQDSIQPYCFDDDGKKTKTNEMNFHALPLPKEELAAIGDEEIEMRVTLSYFIEPSPGRKGWNIKHRYASHGLRFSVIRPLETVEAFKQRISKEFWDGTDEETGKSIKTTDTTKDDRHWAIGEFGQSRGSIHSDFWTGTAGQLSDSGSIAIFPITGWWRERPGQKCVDKDARYSLIVTIRTKKTNLEVYNWVATEVGIPVAVET